MYSKTLNREVTKCAKDLKELRAVYHKINRNMIDTPNHMLKEHKWLQAAYEGLQAMADTCLQEYTFLVNAYVFDELPEEAKEKLYLDYMYIQVSAYDWWIDVYETIHEAGGLLGFDIEVDSFSLRNGFFISIVGDYAYKKGWKKALSKRFSWETLQELTDIGLALQEEQSKHFYSLEARLSKADTRNPNTHIEVTQGDEYCIEDKEYQDMEYSIEWFANWAIHLIDSEYQYLTSRGSVLNALSYFYEGSIFDAEGNEID